MPTFGRRSIECLNTCDDRLVYIAHEAIKVIDFSVICGHRTNEEQDALYAQGRTEPGRIITFKRGGESIHNTWPSSAMDFAPYPIDWSDLVRFGVVAGVMKHIAWQEGLDMFEWGGDWPNFKDYPHVQLRADND